MYTYLLQDWLLIECGKATTESVPNILVQSTAAWLDVGPVKDLVFWIEVASVDDGGVSGLELLLETAPVKDDALFKSVVSAIPLSVTTTPLIRTVLKKDATIPIGAWVRWKLKHT